MDYDLIINNDLKVNTKMCLGKSPPQYNVSFKGTQTTMTALIITYYCQTYDIPVPDMFTQSPNN